jgi:F-type H+-transporting ATPase subunit beta
LIETDLNRRSFGMATTNAFYTPAGDPLLRRTISTSGAPLDDQGPITGALRLLVERPPSVAPAPQLLESGIKVIDLFAPLVRGGVFGLVAPGAGVGKNVVLAELCQRFATFHNGALMLLARQEDRVETNELLFYLREESGCAHRMVAILSQPDDPSDRRARAALVGMTIAEQLQRQGRNVLLLIERQLLDAQHGDQLRSRLRAAQGAITLGIYGYASSAPIDETTPLGKLDAQIVLSRDLAKQKIWPAIDPLASTSQLLETRAVSPEHKQAARSARELLATLALDEAQASGDRQASARRLQLFQSQPFFVAELYTATPAEFVPLAETVRAVAPIVQGAHDTTPEEAFRFAGRIEDVFARAAQMERQS